MPKSAREISDDIRASLKVLDPAISAEPLTPERKIIDTVSETIASSYVDQYIVSYQLDIDTKVGSDLDKFVALFGFGRKRGTLGTGFVTFSRDAPVTEEAIVIPGGTQVSSTTSSFLGEVVFFTTSAGVIPVGGTSVEVPVEAATEGLLGNVTAGTITHSTTAGDISGITNTNATSGGSDPETDAELRARFKNTVFRNIAGTHDQYLALALASQYTKKANVIGPISRFIEYVQVPAGGLITSIIPYSKYTYNFDYYLTDGALVDEVFFQRNGIDYTFTNSIPPQVQINNLTLIPQGSVLLLEHSYTSSNSRNDPANNITNYVDVYVSGGNNITVLESVLFPSSSFNFNNTSGSALYVGKFRRESTGTTPTIGNRFQELLWQPVSVLPSSITISASTFVLNTDYWLVQDSTVFKGSRRARNGIEWSASAASAIDTLAPGEFTIDYGFDRLPLALNELMDGHKPVATDVLVHSAIERFYNVNLIVMYSPGFDKTTVDAGIASAIQLYMERLNFGATVQISDILQAVHNVNGVDNVRLANSNDGIAYGIQEISSDGSTVIGLPLEGDFTLPDSDLPVMNRAVITRRSQNTWTS
jgi:uncharacterized phage protein gp47/JayE